MCVLGGFVCVLGGRVCVLGGFVCVLGGFVCVLGGFVCVLGGCVCVLGGRVCVLGGRVCVLGGRVCPPPVGFGHDLLVCGVCGLECDGEDASAPRAAITAPAVSRQVAAPMPSNRKGYRCRHDETDEMCMILILWVFAGHAQAPTIKGRGEGVAA